MGLHVSFESCTTPVIICSCQFGSKTLNHQKYQTLLPMKSSSWSLYTSRLRKKHSFTPLQPRHGCSIKLEPTGPPRCPDCQRAVPLSLLFCSYTSVYAAATHLISSGTTRLIPTQKPQQAKCILVHSSICSLSRTTQFCPVKRRFLPIQPTFQSLIILLHVPSPVTGTPGTGKTSLCHQLAASVPLQYINIGDLVKEKELHDGWDEEYQSWNLNEDKVRRTSHSQ